MDVWLEAVVLPFQAVLAFFLSSRFATRKKINRRFLHLAWSTLLATALDIYQTFSTHPFVDTVYHAAVILNAWCLMRYVAAYVHSTIGERFNRVLLVVSLALLFTGLDAVRLVSFGPALFFALESFCLQLIYQRYYGNGQFIVMNLLFLLLIDAFALQHVFGLPLPLTYVVGTVLLFLTFFYLEAPAYRQIATAGREAEAARAQIEASTRRTNAANRAKSDFLANTSHEIRTPMNAILGMNEMILNEARDGETRHAAEEIQKAGNHLLTIINNILDLSKIESGKMEVFSEDFALWPMLWGWEKEAKELLKGREGVKFSLDVDTALPARLYGDAGHLRQIVSNLLDNAAKYTQEGTITLRVFGEAKRLKISVSDTGRGIEDVERLFEPFERSSNILGAGLGLPLVKRLTRLLDGHLDVRTEVGKGSVFTVELPLVSGDRRTLGETEREYREKEAQKEARRNGPAGAAGGGEKKPGRLLVVDDTPVNLVVAKGMLKDSGAQVDTAESGEAALEMLKSTHYDIVFLDHQMPGMDGVETLKRAKEIAPDISYVALTANADAREKYLRLGFDDYLSKPFKGDAMMEIVRKWG